MTHIAIAGGGIGGLSAALALARRGVRVTVTERQTDFTELGAGIQLAPNAFRALAQLGVEKEVTDRACHIDRLQLRDGLAGSILTNLDLDVSYRAAFGYPYAVVHRSDLYEPLLRACRADPLIHLIPGLACIGYRQDDQGVEVLTGDGKHLVADALIGADGIRSAVRRQLRDDGNPRISGHTIYRAIVPISEVPEDLRWNAVTLWAGPDWHFVHYLIAGGQYLNLAATINDRATEVVIGQPVPPEEVLPRFGQLHPDAAQVLRLGRDWRSWVMCDRDPDPRWVDARVALLGDAAHPMLQYAAQGACTALEDAVLLGNCFDEENVVDSLAEYARQRAPRAGAIQHVARSLGQHIYHAHGPARRRRNDLLASLSQHDLITALSWLHGSHDFTDIPHGQIPDFNAPQAA